jgi:hypothetical protein
VFERLNSYAEESSGGYILNNNNYVFAGAYTEGFLSSVPIYINDLEIVIDFDHQTSISEKYFIINNVSITRTKYDCKEYTYERPTKQNGYKATIRQRVVHTLKYSNVPGSYLVNSGPLTDTYMGVRLSNNSFKYHPRVDYIQNSFVAPVYHTKTGEYITLVKKTNQNIVTSNVLLRNNYDHSNTDASNNIAKNILCDKEHILESVNKDYMLIGNVNKLGLLSDIAITSDFVYMVPMGARMYLSLEFT